MKRLLVAATLLLLAPRASAAPVVVDRAVARFSDPEASDQSGSLRFVMMRELVIEAWLAAFERAPTTSPSIDEKTLRLALERHVIEAVLGTRALPKAVEARAQQAYEDARRALTISVGGPSRLAEALARATGTESGGAAELETVLRRRARAELYLEVATGQIYEPTEVDLRAAHAKLTLYAGTTYNEDLGRELRAYLRTQRLREGAQAYHQAVRSKLRLEII